MKIQVKHVLSTYPIDVDVLEHDCYAILDYSIEEYSFYSPTPQQIEEGTDHEQTGYMAVCNQCGTDMPSINVWAEIDEGRDYE